MEGPLRVIEGGEITAEGPGAAELDELITPDEDEEVVDAPMQDPPNEQ